MFDAEKFPTAYYEVHGIPTCPNGDKLRTDEQGLFCLVEGQRTAIEVVNGVVQLIVPKPVEKSGKGAKSADGN